MFSFGIYMVGRTSSTAGQTQATEVAIELGGNAFSVAACLVQHHPGPRLSLASVGPTHPTVLTLSVLEMLCSRLVRVSLAALLLTIITS